MSANIGTLTLETDRGHLVIRDLDRDYTFEVVTNQMKVGDKEPDFEVFFKRPSDGTLIPMGAIWSKVGRENGTEYLSIGFNHPRIPEWFANASAFPDREAPGTYRVVK